MIIRLFSNRAQRNGVPLFLALLCLAAGISANAQIKLTLQQAASRTGSDFVPAHEGEQVVVIGQISARPVWVTDSYYLPIQDEGHYGILLKPVVSQLQNLDPGDWVEAQGVIANRAGSPILLPQKVRQLRHQQPPAPLPLAASDLASFRYLGVLVTTENIVTGEDQNGGGDLLLIGARRQDLHVFLPRARRDSGPQLSGFRIGDRIRITGIASQYCTLPPYDRYFQVLIPSPSSIAVLERGWVIQPPFLMAALILAGALALVWWFRERRMAGLRRQMRLLNSLGEQVIGATSSTEILRRLTLNLSALSDASGVGLYIHNRGSKVLEGMHTSSSAVNLVDPEAPATSMASGVAACFRNHALLAVPDTRRSPHFKREEAAVSSPRSVLFVPMFAQAELMGVLEIHHSNHLHYFSQSEQAAMQHLANQIATALKLQEQHSMREQLFRSEKLAAAGQLISDVANELRSPLQSIAMLASALRSQNGEMSHPELESITTEARRANEIVGRLVSFANVEQSSAEPLDLNAILSGLLKFRAPEWKVKGVEIKSHLAVKRAIVLGSPGQIEQVLLNLLVDAEKSAAEARDKVITVSSSLLAKRVLVEIAYPTRGPDNRGDSTDPDHAGSGALGLGVCRGIIEGHGGEFRVVRTAPGQARFDIELPVIEARQASSGPSQLSEAIRQLTVLVVEPDGKVQRQLVELLGDRGDRVVPVSSAEEGLDIVERLRFDMVICAVRLPGLNWIQFCERVRLRVGGFVLLTDAFNSDVGRAFRNSEGYVLTKPVDDTDLYRICRAIEDKTSLLIRE